jgi:hypothetical protein
MAQNQSQAQDPKAPQKPPQTASQTAPQAASQTKQQFQGKLVTKLRDATIGDAFFMEGSDQVVVTLDDGTEQTIRRRELTEVPK